MPGVLGTSIVEGASECPEFPPTILITAFGDDETHEKALRVGVAAVMDKPFDMSELLEKVRTVIAGHEPKKSTQPRPA
jgi:DNA-binding response OmpR family regulator